MAAPVPRACACVCVRVCVCVCVHLVEEGGDLDGVLLELLPLLHHVHLALPLLLLLPPPTQRKSA